MSPGIPLFVVAYQGWSKRETLLEKINEPGIAGILVLQPNTLFAGRPYDEVTHGSAQNAIWAFICAIYFRAAQILEANADLFAYGRGIVET